MQGCHLYYADGILVHNCDAASQALSYMIFSYGGLPEAEDSRVIAARNLAEQEENFFLSGAIYDVYGITDGQLY